MTNISTTLMHYRKALLELWNNYFVDNVKGVKNFEREVDYQFENIRENLFSALVCAKEFENEIHKNSEGYFDDIEVLLKPGQNRTEALYTKAQKGLITEWEYIGLAQKDDYQFKFIDFFDWDTLGQKEGAFVKLYLADSNANRELIGQTFLLPPDAVEYYKCLELKFRHIL